MKTLQITPEGKVVLALAEGPKSYSELRLGLSDSWLSRKIKELLDAGIIERKEGRYTLSRIDVLEEDPLALEYLGHSSSPLAKARLIVEELGKDARVLAILLFGSTAKGSWGEESDLDLLVITDGDVELYDETLGLSLRYSVPIEAVFLSLNDLLMHISLRSTLMLGVLEGYSVLLDRVGIGRLLGYIDERVREEFEYDREAGAWIRRSGPTMR